MPASGPVYQPTTVGYEQQNEWSRPGSYLSQTVSNGLRGPRCVQWLLLAIGCFSLAAGIIMVVEGTVEFADTQQTQLEDKDGNRRTGEESTSVNVILTGIGGLLILTGILLLGAYIRLMRRRKGVWCFPSKEQRLARQLDTQNTNGQYGPVSEITYQPPQVTEEEETRKLMANDNKECIPKGKTKDREKRSAVDRFRNRCMNKAAPLACHEEITPSLRSSFCSVYYQRSVLDSSSEDDEENGQQRRHNSLRPASIRSSLLDSTYSLQENSSLGFYPRQTSIDDNSQLDLDLDCLPYNTVV
ncbi:uncharacterized protein LOC111064318 isoform X2 [Nilaparvata lugens]|uniref:uncharacterized protein LOC111064318 isoform X2 n=1 Tax=Nilaparvata lugens TaxID=108931 RepID=UPI00193E6924|nr:uncharacterized protein LOC111064318 isoform X2 [Nilaparvata lugens]